MPTLIDARQFAPYAWEPAFAALESLADYTAFAASYGPRYLQTREVETRIESLGGAALTSACDPVSGEPRQYQIESSGAGVPINFRETVRDPENGLTARHRSVLLLWQHLQRTQALARRDCYVTEQLTGFYHYVSGLFDAVTGSEYLGAAYSPGQMVDGVRHEDLTRLSFADASFDVLLSLDVLEHVPDYGAALTEIARVLRPGGCALMTAPFAPNQQEHVVRAQLRADGSIEHLLEPEYHGDPARPGEGILCFRYYGWQICAELRQAGFDRACVYPVWSLKHGILGSHMVMCAQKA